MPIARRWLAVSTAMKSKSVAVWRKGSDGRWRCVVDAWNDDAPPPPKR